MTNDVTSAQALDLDRPRDLGELIETTFVLYKGYAVPFALTALVVVAVLDVLVIGIGERVIVDGPRVHPGWGWLVLEGLLPTLVITPVITAMHARTVAAIGSGRTPSVRWALRQGARGFPAVAPVVLLSLVGTVIGMVLLLVPGIYLMVAWFVAAQAASIEPGHSAPSALRRSHELVRGSWWRVFGIFVVLYLMAGLASGVFDYGLNWVAVHYDDGPLAVLARVLGDTITYSFTALFGTLLYFDLRARSRGGRQPVGDLAPQL